MSNISEKERLSRMKLINSLSKIEKNTWNKVIVEKENPLKRIFRQIMAIFKNFNIFFKNRLQK